MSVNDFDVVLQELIDRSVGRLMQADTFDVSAFLALKMHFWQKAPEMRDEYCISKQVLHGLRLASQSIRSRAEYLPAVRAELHWADEFDGMLDRLIAGEIEHDRQAGVPRVL